MIKFQGDSSPVFSICGERSEKDQKIFKVRPNMSFVPPPEDGFEVVIYDNLVNTAMPKEAVSALYDRLKALETAIACLQDRVAAFEKAHYPDGDRRKEK